MGYIREITDYKAWDNFVESTEQGTIFSTSKWLTLLDLPFKIYGYYKSNVLFGGMANFDKPAPLTPFQGILVARDSQAKYTTRMSLHNEVAKALVNYAPSHFYNHYTFPDIRPFKWDGWQCDVRYTYVVDLTDMDRLWEGLEKQTRYEINHALKTYQPFMTPDVNVFNSLYSETFKRRGLERPIDSEMVQRLCFTLNAAIFCSLSPDSVGSMAVFIEDNKRAYYLLGASNDTGQTSSLTLWSAFEKLARAGVKEVDLVGCNNEQIGLFKRGFGGLLNPYYGVTRR
tara:strand:+ start:18102 stop:18956 length:855 start_codon:yes stop_codon:yes gene_type:complete